MNPSRCHLRLKICKGLFNPAIKCIPQPREISTFMMCSLGKKVFWIVQQTDIERGQSKSIQ